MIINTILSLLVSFVQLIVSMIPTISLDIDVVSYVTPLADVFGYIDSFVSVPVLLMCIGAIIIVDNFSLIVKIVVFIYTKIPFVG